LFPVLSGYGIGIQDMYERDPGFRSWYQELQDDQGIIINIINEYQGNILSSLQVLVTFYGHSVLRILVVISTPFIL
jgi:hypothetical protein